MPSIALNIFIKIISNFILNKKLFGGSQIIG